MFISVPEGKEVMKQKNSRLVKMKRGQNSKSFIPIFLTFYKTNLQISLLFTVQIDDGLIQLLFP